MGAIFAFAGIVLLLLAELSGCLADIGGFDYGGLMLMEFVGGAAILLSAIGGMGEGKLWAVKLFRWSTHAAVGLYLAIVACGIYIYARETSADTALAWVIFILAIIQLPGFFVIYRAFRRVRWLDPKSLPHEWEPPARQVDQRFSDDPPKRGVLGWLLTGVFILAAMTRYYIGILRMDWFGVWLSSDDLWKELGVLMALLAPILVLTGCFLTRRAAFWYRRIGE